MLSSICLFLYQQQSRAKHQVHGTNSWSNVQNLFSVISAGTEGSSLKSGGAGVSGLVSKVKNNPELLQKALEMVKTQGVSQTINVIQGQLEKKLIQLGYSSSEVVLEAGRNITDIATGDKVACAGVKNLVVADKVWTNSVWLLFISRKQHVSPL